MDTDNNILFGSYPQDRVEDSNLINILNEESDKLEEDVLYAVDYNREVFATIGTTTTWK